MEVRLEDRLEHALRCGHHHPVGDGGNAERTGLAPPARLRDAHPPERLRAIAARPKCPCEPVEERSHRLGTPGFDVGDGDAVHTGGTLVGGHVDPRLPHHVAAGELVEEDVEAARPVLLGAAIQHALEDSDGVQALGLSDGPSRDHGTRQRPSPPSRAPMKQGPFALAGLCCPARPHYYDPLRLPLDHRPLPGAPVIGRHALDPRRVEAEEGLSSSLVTLLAVPRPLRRGIHRRPLQGPWRLPWPSPNPHRLGIPTFPASREPSRRCRLRFTLRTGQLLHPASTPDSRPNPGASLPGTLASPRTGLAPAG